MFPSGGHGTLGNVLPSFGQQLQLANQRVRSLGRVTEQLGCQVCYSEERQAAPPIEQLEPHLELVEHVGARSWSGGKPNKGSISLRERLTGVLPLVCGPVASPCRVLSGTICAALLLKGGKKYNMERTFS